LEHAATAKARDICERTFAFAVRIVKLCREMDKVPGTNRLLARQLLRAGTSIGANVEEAQAAQSKADFINKYAIALKEARETVYWLRLIAAAELIAGSRIADLRRESEELGRISASIIVNTKTGGG
jgi:four helix bundle protein